MKDSCPQVIIRRWVMNTINNLICIQYLVRVLVINVVVSANHEIFGHLGELATYRMSFMEVSSPQQQSPSPSGDDDKTPPGPKKHA